MALFARFSLVLEDKNRPAVYSFSISEFRRKVAHWLPDDLKGKISELSDIPAEFNLLDKPTDNRPADFYKIEFDGTMKGTSIYFFIYMLKTLTYLFYINRIY